MFKSYIIIAVSAKLISAFVFATRIVQSLYFLNLLAVFCYCAVRSVSDLVTTLVFPRGGSFIVFSSSVMRILPRDMRPHVRLEDVVILHKSMIDLMPAQAVLQFIEVLKSWPLFGASIFEISVRLQHLHRLHTHAHF